MRPRAKALSRLVCATVAPGHAHRRGRVHVGDVLQRVVEHLRHAPLQQKAQEPHRHRQNRRRAERPQQALDAELARAREQKQAVRPDDEVKGRHHGRQIKDALRAEHGHHQRDAHEPAVGIDDGKPLDGHVVLAAPAQAEVGHRHGDAKAQQRQQEGLPQPRQQLGREVPLVGYEDHNRVDQQDQQVGQVLIPFPGDDVGLEADEPRHHEDEHQDHLVEDYAYITGHEPFHP